MMTFDSIPKIEVGDMSISNAKFMIHLAML